LIEFFTSTVISTRLYSARVGLNVLFIPYLTLKWGKNFLGYFSLATFRNEQKTPSRCRFTQNFTGTRSKRLLFTLTRDCWRCTFTFEGYLINFLTVLQSFNVEFVIKNNLSEHQRGRSLEWKSNIFEKVIWKPLKYLPHSNQILAVKIVWQLDGAETS
jgi:hypothetical protein